MADKLSESTWSAFTKKQKLSLDDGPLLKALARFDKADEAKHEARAEAATEVAEQIKKQVAALSKRKKELGDKPFGEAKDKLYELLELAEKAEKAARAAAAEEDEESPEMLTTDLAKLLRQVLKGEVAMPALVALGSKAAAVLVQRRSISVARRKLLAEHLDQASGLKYFPGSCSGEGKLLRFELEAPAGGLAKKLREAVLDQTGLRLKVVVKVAGSDVVEEDGADEEDDEAPRPEGGDATADDAQRKAYEARLDKLQPRLEAALRALHPEASKLRAVMGFASEKAAQTDYAGAAKALDMLVKLLGAGSIPVAPPGPGPGPSPSPSPVTAKAKTDPTADARFARLFVPARAAWRDAKEAVDGQLAALQRALQSETDPDLVRIAEFGLNAVTANLMTPLQAALMDVERAPSGTRAAVAAKARAAAQAFATHIASDERVAVCDDNPFGVAVAVRGTLAPALAQLETALAAA